MIKSLSVALFTLITTVVLARFLSRYAYLLNLMDKPDDRKRHSEEVPLMGGLAIYFSTAISFFIFNSSNDLMYLWIVSFFVLCLGLLDDALGLGVFLRLFFQMLISTFLIISGSFLISDFGFFVLNSDIISKFMSVSITVLAFMILMNSFNMLDGIDGLLAGQTIISLAFVSIAIVFFHGFDSALFLPVVLIASTLGFLLLNVSLLPGSKIFLGDAGSLLLGFLLSGFLIYVSQPPRSMLNPVAALWCVALPIFDVGRVIALRWLLGKSVTKADRLHIHHLFLDKGFGSTFTLCWLVVLSSFFSGFGISLTYICGADVSIIILSLGFILYCLLVNRCYQSQLKNTSKGA